MSVAPSTLTRRLENLERRHADHEVNDADQFGKLRDDITNLGIKLGAKIDNVTSGLQIQIDAMTRDHIRAEGRAEGVAETLAATTQPAWWHPWARWAVGGIVTGTIALIAVMASTIWNLEQGRLTSLQNRPAATVTVNPPPPPPGTNP